MGFRRCEICDLFYREEDSEQVFLHKHCCGKDHLAAEALENGALYLIRARRAAFGVWNAESGGFVIAREKFGEVYLFEELHHDVSSCFGTAQPYLKLLDRENIPEDASELLEWLKTYRLPSMATCHEDNRFHV